MSGVTLAFVGGGNLARALVEGALARGLPGLGAAELAVAEPDAEKRAWFSRVGVRAVAAASELSPLLDSQSQLLLAVKPQSLGSAAKDVSGLSAGRVLISVLAGTPSATIRSALGTDVRIIRAMPNTPARVGQAATAIALGEGARPGDEELARQLFGGVGPLVMTIPESLMDAFTAVASSGPAYVFYLAEVMVQAAVKLGFSIVDADRMVRQTVLGAGMLLSSSKETVSELRAAVTSPGGTTQAATRVLDDAGVMGTVVAAVTAARDRGNELGRGT